MHTRLRSMSVTPLPRRGGVQADARNDGRSLRVSAHPGSGTVVMSIWRAGTCIATHRVTTADIPDLIKLLAGCLVEPVSASRSQVS